MGQVIFSCQWWQYEVRLGPLRVRTNHTKLSTKLGQLPDPGGRSEPAPRIGGQSFSVDFGLDFEAISGLYIVLSHEHGRNLNIRF